MKKKPVKNKQRSNDMSLWIVGRNANVKKFKLTYFRLCLLAGLFTMLGGGLFMIAGDYTRVQYLRLKSYLQLQQVKSQRDSLAKSNNKLEDEVTSLRELNTRVMLYQQDVTQKLTEISQIVEQATSMGVPEEDSNSSTTLPLEDGVSEGGIGGAEIDCTGTGAFRNCNGPSISDIGALGGQLDAGVLVGKKQIAFASGRQSISLPSFDNNLIGKMNGLTSLLKDLPMGNPASGKITSGFGVRVSPFSHHESVHEGLDISLSQGSAVKCSGEGIVKQIDNHPTYGLMVDVEHNDRIITRYAHLSKISVKENQKVNVGDIIGLSGSTGRSTGPHLHYEVRVDGKAKNPRNFMRLVQNLKTVL